MRSIVDVQKLQGLAPPACVIILNVHCLCDPLNVHLMTRVWQQKTLAIRGGGNLHTATQRAHHTDTTEFTELIDKAISQNVRLLGCLCKTCEHCDNCYHSTRLEHLLKKTLEREKGTTLFVTLQPGDASKQNFWTARVELI